MKTMLACAAAFLALATAACATAHPAYSERAAMPPLTPEMAAPGAEGIGYLAKRCAAVNALFAALAVNDDGQKHLFEGFVAQRDSFISLAVRELADDEAAQSSAEDEVASMAEGYVYRVTDNRIATGSPMDDQIVSDLLLCQSLLKLAPEIK